VDGLLLEPLLRDRPLMTARPPDHEIWVARRAL
jgi:hypothetical protein